MNAPEWLQILDNIGYITMRTLLSILWQSSIVLVGIGILSYLLRRRKATVRHLLWLSAILSIPLLPLLTVGIAKIGTPQKELAVMPAYSKPNVNIIEAPAQPNVPVRSESRTLLNDEQKNESLIIHTPSPDHVIEPDVVEDTIPDVYRRYTILGYPWAVFLVVYCCGVLLLLLWIIIGRLRIRGWILSGDAVADHRVINIFQRARERLGITREFVVIENRHVPAPLTCRVFRPVIILPVGFTKSMAEDELQAVAFHELSHVKRNDVIVFSLLSFVKAMFFFHPLVWLAARQVSYLAELTCDSVVVDFTNEPVTYADMLTRIAEHLPNRKLTTELAVGIIFSKSMFFRRVSAILESRKHQIRTYSKRALAGIVILSCAFLMLSLSFPLGEKEHRTGNSVQVSGMVLHKGEPVSYATLYLVDQQNFNYRLYSIEKVARTRRDGSFSFACAEYHLMRQWHQSLVVAYHPRYAVRGITLTSTLDVGSLNISLNNAATVGGRVVDSEDNPLKGAEVTVRTILTHEKGFNYYETFAIPELKVKTDRSGRYVIGNIPSGANLGIEVTCRGYAKTNSFKIFAGRTDVDFTLEPEGRIKGRVVYDDTGKPARNVSIFADCIEFRKPDSDVVTTDRRGYFTIPNLATSIYHVTFPADDAFPEWTAQAAENISVESGGTVDGVELRLIRGGIVTGRVTDSDTGQPLAGVTVFARPKKTNSILILDKTVTDTNGVYRLRIVPGHFGFGTSAPPGYLFDFKPVQNEVREGGTVDDCDFTFTQGITINGKVFSPEGEPVAGAVVIGRRYSDWRGKVISDKQGGFTISGLKEGGLLQIEAFITERHLQTWADFEIHDGIDIEIHLEQYETASIEGRLVDEQGNPIPGAPVKLTKSEKAPNGHTFSIKNSIVAVTDDEGMYQMSDMIIGENQGYLSVFVQGYKLSGIIAKMDSLATGLNRLEDVVLVSEIPPDRWLDCTVTDLNGESITGARVSINSGYWPTKNVFSDSRGHFRLEGLKPEVEPEISIQHPDYGFYQFEYLETNRSHIFVLYKIKGVISGKVTDPDGNPLAGVGLRIADHNLDPSGIMNFYHQTDEQGNFTLSNLINESYKITAYSPDKRYKKLENVKINTTDLHIVLSKEDTYEHSPQMAAYIDYRKATKERRKNLIGNTAPEIDAGQWLVGAPVKLADLRGKVVVLYFWNSKFFSTVKPSVVFNNWQKNYGPDGVVIIAVHPYMEDIDAVREIIEKKEITYHTCIDKKIDLAGAGGVICDAYVTGAVKEIPVTIIIARDGNIFSRESSLLGGTQIHIREIEKKIKELIGED